MDDAGRRITDWPPDQRPRERLLRLGPDALTDAEVLAVLIGSGRPGRTAVDVSRDLLTTLGGTAGLRTATAQRIGQVSGVGPAATARILAATELRRRMDLAEPRTTVSNTAGVADAVLAHLADRAEERLVVAVLDTALRVIDIVTLAEGSSSHASLPVAEVVRTVLTAGGSAFALAHNHPSGGLDPSDADRRATEQVRAASAACGLRFLDHLVVAGRTWRAI